MTSTFNPLEQFSIYPPDDYGDHGGLLSHEVVARDTDEQAARRSHPSSQPADEGTMRRNALREQLAS